MPRTTKRKPAADKKKSRKQHAAASPVSVTAKHAASDFPIVVVGASAGGLDALRKLLAAAPPDNGIAWVLIPHLDPKHESLMADLLGKHTEMPVREATPGMKVAANCVYVIPPNRYLAIRHGAIELSDSPEPRGVRTAIDFALQSLARDRQDEAIGVILSGTGSHGVLGAKEIKLAGGAVFAQDPATAEHDQMPRSAIAAGLVDQALAPEQLPEALRRYWKGTHPHTAAEAEAAEDGLRRVLSLLQARTKHDFHHYRKNMLARRVKRRMALLEIDDWQGYVAHMRDNPKELTALRQDLLISVTSFFRDPGAFAALAEAVVPKLVARANADLPVRVWVPGCASGEEAYSIAILLIEQFEAADKPLNIQVFATDIDDRSLEKARQGVYPDSIAAVLEPKRLQRFFVAHGKHHYQVSRELRDSVVVAPQNLISDAPFSKLDLISCRNVLIYLEPATQQRIVALLHFALREGGYLLLGPSESIGRATSMFEQVSKKWRLYRRIGPARRDLINVPLSATGEGRPRSPRLEPARPSTGGFGRLMQHLLAEEFAPASALVDRHYTILSVQGPLVNYLEFPAGEMKNDLLAMARQGLRVRIRTTCQKALAVGHAVTDNDVRVRRNGHYVPCAVTVRPITEPAEAEGLLLVVFQDRPEGSSEPRPVVHDEVEAVVKQLEDELRSTRDDLHGTIEELETSNEDLKASNEEIMSMNEELQSTNEELETSKEELQSLNEELATVNSQLEDKVEELDAANSDLTNLMAATDVATLFLDTELRIKRFTPPTARLLNLINADIGRPLRDFSQRFQDDDLLRSAQGVLETSTAVEKAVHSDHDRWYLRRITPYQEDDARIGGVVITFVDITERVEADAQARRLATVLRDSNDAIIVSDFGGRIMNWNYGATRTYGYSEPEALTMNVVDLVPEDLRGNTGELTARVRRGETIEPFETARLTRDGRRCDVSVTITPLTGESGKPVAVAWTERDITARKRNEQRIHALNAALEQRVAERTAELAASEQRIRSVVEAAVDAIVTIDDSGRIEWFNQAAEKMFGYTASEALGQNVSILMPSPAREEHDTYLRRYRQTRERRVIGTTRELSARRKDGTLFPAQLSVNEVDGLNAFTGVIRDMTEQKALQEEILRIATLEQRRIGHELHDGTQQELTGLGLLAQHLSAMLDEANHEQRGLAAKLAAGIAEANQHVRSLAHGLVPVAVDSEGLMAALAALAKSTEALPGVRCRFEYTAPVRVDDDLVAAHLYRIAQEAVANATKHAQATSIVLSLTKRDGGLELEVRDDGSGIPPEAARGAGLGLRIMQHRCALIGGALEVARQETGGTTVSCRIPRLVQR